MTESRPAGQKLVLMCNCVHYDLISQDTKEQTLHLLADAGARVQVVADLCGLAASRDPRLSDWAASPSLTIVACFPRAIRWLFHAGGAQLSEERARFFNMRTQSPAEIIQGLMKDDGLLMTEEHSATSASNCQSSIIDHQSDWVPWFPVIDYDRCVNCRQCMNFCLFGVYALSDEGQVTVHKPSGCKTNCPACARMCPQKAIIFPKYADPPINGDESGGSGAMEEKPVVAGDLYERIRSGSAGGKRFATGTMGDLQRELNIPADVLASLSPEEMQRVIGKNKARSTGDQGDKRDE